MSQVVTQNHGTASKRTSTATSTTCAVTCEGIYADVQLALLEEKEKREDMEKVSVLMQQYNDFKRKTLPNFRFNPEKKTAHYGMSFQRFV